MLRLQRILVATDLSEPARYAAERAAALAKELEATLELVYVVPKPPIARLRWLVSETRPKLQQRVLDAAREELRQLAAHLLRAHGVSPGAHVVSGPLLQELVTQIKRMSPDLTIVGARGASTVRHLLLGTTAERLLGTARRPMLVVKQPPRERYRSVLVPVDFSPASVAAVRAARTVAPAASIRLLHAFEVPFEGMLQYASVDEDQIYRYRIAARQEALQKLRRLSEEASLPAGLAVPLVLHGNPSVHILEQERETGCDLIVMGKHGQDKLEELLLGSTTKHVLVQSQCDVLVSL